MSYDAWGEPDDDDWPERAAEAGWVSEDVVEEVRTLLKEVEFQTRPGSRHDAALILIENKINPPADPNAPEDPHVTWAKRLLADLGVYPA